MATEAVSETRERAPPVPLRRLFRRRRHREGAFVWALLLPALAIFLLYRLIPLGWNFVLSFEFWEPTKPTEFAGLYHYEEMLFYDDVFWQALENTFVYMAMAPIAIVIALALWRSWSTAGSAAAASIGRSSFSPIR